MIHWKKLCPNERTISNKKRKTKLIINGKEACKDGRRKICIGGKLI